MCRPPSARRNKNRARTGSSRFPNNHSAPHALLHHLKHNKALHQQVIILCVRVADIPYVPETARLEVEELSATFVRIVIHYGFKDETDIPKALAPCTIGGKAINLADATFYLGREALIPKRKSEMAYWREIVFVAMFRNAGSATAFFRIPPNRVVELGAQVVL